MIKPASFETCPAKIDVNEWIPLLKKNCIHLRERNIQFCVFNEKKGTIRRPFSVGLIFVLPNIHTCDHTKKNKAGTALSSSKVKTRTQWNLCLWKVQCANKGEWFSSQQWQLSRKNCRFTEAWSFYASRDWENIPNKNNLSHSNRHLTKRRRYVHATAGSEVQETNIAYKQQVETCGIGFFCNYSHNKRKASYNV